MIAAENSPPFGIAANAATSLVMAGGYYPLSASHATANCVPRIVIVLSFGRYKGLFSFIPRPERASYAVFGTRGSKMSNLRSQIICCMTGF